MKPTNAPTLTIHNRPCYISGIHITRGLIIRYLDTDNEFTTIPYDNTLIRAGAPREIPFSSLTRHDKIRKK